MRFGGPDVGSSSDWITRFGREVAPKLGSRLVALTGHYYAEGPPDDPRVTTTRLLTANPAIAASMAKIEAVAHTYSLRYHMTEGNSCYRGGKPGMSNAFAAALWAADNMLLLASLGCAGVNLHGGDSRFLSAGLGDHNPGFDAAGGQVSKHNGFYTPIASERGQLAAATPVFYGMLFANQFAGAEMLDCAWKADGNVTAYAAQSGTAHKVAIINKDEGRSFSFSLRAEHTFDRAAAWRAKAPSLGALMRIRLGGPMIGLHGEWQPHATSVSVEGGVAQAETPASSAALVFLE